MITVRFNDVEEFIAELKAHPPIVRVIRLTQSFEQSKTFPIQNVSVLATALRHVWLNESVEPHLIKLSRYIGQCYVPRDDSVSKAVEQRAVKVMSQIEEAAKELTLEVRAGVFE